MAAELIGAAGLVLAAIVTELFRRLRRENTEAHNQNNGVLKEIAQTVSHIDEEVSEISEWVQEHDELHKHGL
jgi:NTP pyrophosphatase (non-canonical NTP hydrolase)